MSTITQQADDNIAIEPGGSYLLDVKELRKTRNDWYARRSSIHALRKQVESYLSNFFKQASNKNLTVCVLLHGFTSSHTEMEKGIAGNLEALKDNKKIVKLYIDWDTSKQVKFSNIFTLARTLTTFITDGVDNAYDINDLLGNVIKMHEELVKKKIAQRLSVFVFAHSMGSHVAEAFIKGHESLDLKGVIYFNPHTDHTFYNIEDVESLYFNKNMKKGFVLTFNSAQDEVLRYSTRLQNAKRALFFIFSFTLNGTFISPLGLSWEDYNNKSENGHRVVAFHMERKCWFPKLWYPIVELNHASYSYKPCQEIANDAFVLAMANEEFSISAIKDLLKDDHCLYHEDSTTSERSYDVEYVNNKEVENENEVKKTGLKSGRYFKIKAMEQGEQATSPDGSSPLLCLFVVVAVAVAVQTRLW